MFPKLIWELVWIDRLRAPPLSQSFQLHTLGSSLTCPSLSTSGKSCQCRFWRLSWVLPSPFCNSRDPVPPSDFHRSPWGRCSLLRIGLIPSCLTHSRFIRYILVNFFLLSAHLIIWHLHFCSKSFEGFLCRRIEFSLFTVPFRTFYSTFLV